jgi:Domain of unknown function (DUF1818)
MPRELLKGVGWRLGWDADAPEFQALIGTDDWATELTQAEFADFCRLLTELVAVVAQMGLELMDEEAIACEASSDRLWMEVRGYPESYTLSVILLSGRRVEALWSPTAVPQLLSAVRGLQVF